MTSSSPGPRDDTSKQPLPTFHKQFQSVAAAKHESPDDKAQQMNSDNTSETKENHNRIVPQAPSGQKFDSTSYLPENANHKTTTRASLPAFAPRTSAAAMASAQGGANFGMVSMESLLEMQRLNHALQAELEEANTSINMLRSQIEQLEKHHQSESAAAPLNAPAQSQIPPNNAGDATNQPGNPVQLSQRLQSEPLFRSTTDLQTSAGGAINTQAMSALYPAFQTTHNPAKDGSMAFSNTDDGAVTPKPAAGAYNSVPSLNDVNNMRLQATSANQSQQQQSRYWTQAEHDRFLEGLERFGAKDVRAIANHVGTRNATQVRTHAQKYFLRIAREAKDQGSAPNESSTPPSGGNTAAAKRRSLSEGDLTRLGRHLAERKAGTSRVTAADLASDGSDMFGKPGMLHSSNLTPLKLQYPVHPRIPDAYATSLGNKDRSETSWRPSTTHSVTFKKRQADFDEDNADESHQDRLPNSVGIAQNFTPTEAKRYRTSTDGVNPGAESREPASSAAGAPSTDARNGISLLSLVAARNIEHDV